MKIEKKVIEDIMILEVKGKIIIGEGVDELRSAINSIVEEGFKKVILALGNVPYIDSTGLGEIVRSYTTVKKAGGEIIVYGLTNKVKDHLSVTKLIHVFSFSDTFESAIEEFKTGKNK